MKPSQRVSKNIAWMLVAGGLGAVLQMLAVLLAARSLSLGDFGTFNYLFRSPLFSSSWLISALRTSLRAKWPGIPITSDTYLEAPRA